MIKGLTIWDLMNPEEQRECQKALAIDPSEENTISNGILNALECYLAMQINPKCDKDDYDEAATGVIVTAFQIGYLRGGRAAKEGKFKEPQK